MFLDSYPRNDTFGCFWSLKTVVIVCRELPRVRSPAVLPHVSSWALGSCSQIFSGSNQLKSQGQRLMDTLINEEIDRQQSKGPQAIQWELGL